MARHQAFTLPYNAYDQARRANAYLRWDGDEYRRVPVEARVWAPPRA